MWLCFRKDKYYSWFFILILDVMILWSSFGGSSNFNFSFIYIRVNFVLEREFRMLCEVFISDNIRSIYRIGFIMFC